MERINCLNNWDVQSKHVHTTDGIIGAIYAGECRYGGGEAYILYPAELEKNYSEQCKMSESVGSAEQETVHD